MQEIKIQPRVEVKVSLACRLGCLGKGCDYADKGSLLPDGTPICIARMPVSDYEPGIPTFCCQNQFNIIVKK